MATISSTLRLHDQVSGALSSISKAANNTSSSLSKMENDLIKTENAMNLAAANASIYESKIASLSDEMDKNAQILQTWEKYQKTAYSANRQKDIDKFIQKQDKLNDEYQKAEVALLKANNLYDEQAQKLGQLEEKISGVSDSQQHVNQGYTIFKGLATSAIQMAIGKTKELISYVIDTGDELTMVSARLNTIVGDTEAVALAQEGIFDAAQRSNVEYSNMAGNIADILQSIEAVDGNLQTATDFAELMNKGLRLIGESNIDSAMGSVVDYLSDGEVTGRELTAMLKSVPGIVDTVASALDMSRPKLEAFADEGSLSSEIFMLAFLSAADKINEEYAELPVTMNSVWTEIKNDAVGAAGGVSGYWAKAIDSIYTDLKNKLTGKTVLGMHPTAMLSTPNIETIAEIAEVPDAIAEQSERANIYMEQLIGSLAEIKDVETDVVEETNLLGDAFSKAAQSEFSGAMQAEILSDKLAKVAVSEDKSVESYRRMSSIMNRLNQLVPNFTDNLGEENAALAETIMSLEGLSDVDMSNAINGLAAMTNETVGLVSGIDAVTSAFYSFAQAAAFVKAYEGLMTDTATAIIKAEISETQLQPQYQSLVESAKTAIGQYTSAAGRFTSAAAGEGGELGSIYDQLSEQQAIISEGYSDLDYYLENMLKQQQIVAEFGDTFDGTVSGSGSGAAVKTTSDDLDIFGENIKLLLDLATRGYFEVTYQTLTPQISVSVDTVRETADIDQIIEVIAVEVEEMAEASLVYG